MNAGFVNHSLPIISGVAFVFVLVMFVGYRTRYFDHFLWVIRRPIRETRDYQRIHGIIMRQVQADLAEQLLTPAAHERIAGAAERAVAQVREHGSVEVRLPRLYERRGQPCDVVVNVVLKTEVASR